MANPLPSPPFIDIPGIHNFRGVGGSHMGPGLIFRSADPSKATADGLRKMSQDLGIRMIFDLRSAPEIKRDGPEWADVPVDNADVFAPYGMTRAWVPVFAEQDYGPEAVALRYKEYTRSGTAGFVKAYHDILLSGHDAYGKIFRHLAGAKPAPCLIHCTAGKDRTGVLVALLLMLAGAGDEEISQEYALTDLGLAELKPVFKERLLRNPALEGSEVGVTNMISAKRENMEAALEMIQREFGGVREYMVRNCGMAEEEVERVKRNLVEGSLAGLS